MKKSIDKLFKKCIDLIKAGSNDYVYSRDFYAINSGKIISDMSLKIVYEIVKELNIRLKVNPLDYTFYITLNDEYFVYSKGLFAFDLSDKILDNCFIMLKKYNIILRKNITKTNVYYKNCGTTDIDTRPQTLKNAYSHAEIQPFKCTIDLEYIPSTSDLNV